MLRIFFTLICLLAAASLSASPWTYRGSLQDGGKPAEGRYDLRLTLLDASGMTTLVGPITRYGVEVKNGQFATDVDFGGELTSTAILQLRTEVSIGDAAFVAIGEPKPFDPKGTPNVCWDTHGNLGTIGANDFLGTIDNQPLRFVVNDQVVGRFESSNFGLPNIYLGSTFNSALNGVAASVVLGGGSQASLGNTAIGSNATISGGIANAAANGGTVAGGSNNQSGPFAFAVGELNCAGGDYSFAAGRRAKVRAGLGDFGYAGCSSGPVAGDAAGDSGTFVWADDQNADFASTGDRQFLVRADGGIMFNTNVLPSSFDDLVLKARTGNGDADVDLRLVTGTGRSASLFLRGFDGSWRFTADDLTGPDFLTFTNNARLTAGGTWTNASSRSLKHDFAAVDAHQVLDKVLALPIMTWQYNASMEGPHMGPVAEDFHAAFGLGDSDRSISTIDADGVALAAIQGLYQVLQAERQLLRNDNKLLRNQNAALLARVAAIEQRERDRQ